MRRKTAFVYDDVLAAHALSETHPMKPVRLKYTYELLKSYDAFDGPNATLVTPRQATEEEILWHHTPDYLQAVQSLSKGETSFDPARFNFGPGDNPAYEGIYEAAVWSTGGSLTAAELLASGEVNAAFSISGGLHHAMPGYAYGFCVFNDPVIAIKALTSRGMRVAYVDIDCHHGDGVQHAFYDTDSVLTISLHESGAFLFPGTGFTQEVGAGRGRGYSVNLPLYPYTSDEAYLWAFREVGPAAPGGFRRGRASHTAGHRLSLPGPDNTSRPYGPGIWTSGFRISRALRPNGGLPLEGGGYDLQAVARSWATAYGVMSEQELANEIPESYRQQYGVEGLKDPDRPPITEAVERDTRTFAEAGVQAVQRLIFPTHGLRSG